MRKHVLLFVISILFAGVLFAQDTQRPLVAGTYRGNLPCEDCKIIETSLDLKYGTDSTGEFSLRDKYVSKGGTDITSRISGEWIIAKDIFEGNKVMMIILNYDNEDKAMYFVLKADGNLLPLDKERHRLASDIDCTLRRLL